MKFFFLVSMKVTDTWASSTGLPGSEGRRTWCENNVRMNLAEYAIRCLPNGRDEPSEALVDALDSPDHAHSVFILRSGWPVHGMEHGAARFQAIGDEVFGVKSARPPFWRRRPPYFLVFIWGALGWWFVAWNMAHFGK